MGVPVGLAPTPPQDKGVVKGSWGFIGTSDGLGDGKERDTNFGVRTFVGAKVGQGDGMNGIFAVVNRTVHEESTHGTEFGTLEWFGEDVCPHVFCRAIF